MAYEKFAGAQHDDEFIRSDRNSIIGERQSTDDGWFNLWRWRRSKANHVPRRCDSISQQRQRACGCDLRGEVNVDLAVAILVQWPEATTTMDRQVSRRQPRVLRRILPAGLPQFGKQSMSDCHVGQFRYGSGVEFSHDARAPHFDCPFRQ